ncbi:MAG: hypothetical protein HKN82_14155 [Akkermansiaceae bacterium]|nr:hypothetical protein [Akkermansiaceae bacterium]
MQATYEKYKKDVDFYLVYLKEAHASDGPRPNRQIEIEQHKTLDDRRAAASSCVAELDLSLPLLIDDMRDTVGNAFAGHPDRLFILSPDGTIAYRGDRGPRGFRVDEMTAALDKLLEE